ncbi:collagen alpha-1(I) chain-like [Lagopus muta]|uniref:collagen alpha-1(I) chain-like n=1 Tax=Lagopus muta TaxID=64668 RepID=UPI00209E5301|nr:collagen alpha-1(I) chain-like [Lagopus muta]
MVSWLHKRCEYLLHARNKQKLLCDTANDCLLDPPGRWMARSEFHGLAAFPRAPRLQQLLAVVEPTSFALFVHSVLSNRTYVGPYRTVLAGCPPVSADRHPFISRVSETNRPTGLSRVTVQTVPAWSVRYELKSGIRSALDAPPGPQAAPAGGRAATGHGVRTCSGLALPPHGGGCGQQRGHGEGQPKSHPGPLSPEGRPPGTAREPRHAAGAVSRQRHVPRIPGGTETGNLLEARARSPGAALASGFIQHGRCGVTSPSAAPLGKGPVGSSSAGRAPGGEPLRSAAGFQAALGGHRRGASPLRQGPSRSRRSPEPGGGRLAGRSARAAPSGQSPPRAAGRARGEASERRRREPRALRRPPLAPRPAQGSAGP